MFNFLRRKKEHEHKFKTCRFVAYLNYAEIRGVAQRAIVKANVCDICGLIEGAPEKVESLYDIDSLTLDTKDYDRLEKFGFVVL